MAVVKLYNPTLNQNKYYFRWKGMKLLSCIIRNSYIQSEPESLSPLVDLPVLNKLSVRRIFAYYPYWISTFINDGQET